MWRELIRGERLGNGTRMRRKVCPHGRESAARISGAIIHGRVVSLHALGNRSTELLTVLRARDALTFRWIAQKAGLEEQCWDADISQHLETRMAHTAVKRSDARENSSVHGRGQRHV